MKTGTLEQEQRFFDYTLGCREAMRAACSQPAAGADAKGAGALTRSLRAQAQELQPPDAAPAFGRFLTDESESFYVGYDRIRSGSDLLVISWKAPLAAKWYEATPNDPQGVQVKRSFRTAQTRILDFEDTILRSLAERIDSLHASNPQTARSLAATGPEFSDSLLESLNSRRTTQMVDIVQTIHAAQYPIIRAPLAGTLHVQGGPGTGKTVVALHRVSWLLYNYRDSLDAKDILIVGPNTAFVQYIHNVLPTLGDTRVSHVSVNGLVPGVSPTRAEGADVKRLKGESRMALLLRRAWNQARSAGRAKESPKAFLQRLLASERLLLEAAGTDFTAREVLLLHRPATARVGDEQWSETDIALLDELNWLMVGTAELRRYKHVVIDEAQDLSPMQLRTLRRRARSDSMTVLGDIAQSTGPWRRRSWSEVFEDLGVSDVESRELEYGYRVPAPIYEMARTLLPAIAPDASPPRAIRPGHAPRVQQIDPTEIHSAAASSAKAHARQGRMVGVVAPSDTLQMIAAELSGQGVPWRDTDRDGLAQGINLLPTSWGKGLELEAMVVVEPAAIADHEEGLNHLYVALTRPTEYLEVLYSDSLGPLEKDAQLSPPSGIPGKGSEGERNPTSGRPHWLPLSGKSVALEERCQYLAQQLAAAHRESVDMRYALSMAEGRINSLNQRIKSPAQPGPVKDSESLTRWRQMEAQVQESSRQRDAANAQLGILKDRLGFLEAEVQSIRESRQELLKATASADEILHQVAAQTEALSADLARGRAVLQKTLDRFKS